MNPKDIPELITRFAEAVRAHERAELGDKEAVHQYREARSELSCRFHKVLEERDALKSYILGITDRLDKETILDSVEEIQDWHNRTPEALNDRTT